MKRWIRLWISTGISVFIAGLAVLLIFYLLKDEKDVTVADTFVPKVETTAGEAATDSVGDGSVMPGMSIMLESRNEVPEAEHAENVTMTFAGDLLLQSPFLEILKTQGVSGIMDEGVLHAMRDVDLTFLNQEFPIGTTGEAQDKTYTFRIAPEVTQYMKEMGIDGVTLGNNHTLDYGRSALEETFQALEQAQIAYVGAGRNAEDARRMYHSEIHDKKITILGASRVIPDVSWNATANQSGVFTTYDPTLLLEDIRTASETSDFVVVYVHWGVEKSVEPEEYQRELAKAYIDAGADLILGSHSHVLQGFEYMDGVPVVYSMGNFIFNMRTKDSMMVKVELDENSNSTLQIIPCGMVDGKMTEKSQEEKEEAYRYLESISYQVRIDENGILHSADYPAE